MGRIGHPAPSRALSAFVGALLLSCGPALASPIDLARATDDALWWAVVVTQALMGIVLILLSFLVGGGISRAPRPVGWGRRIVLGAGVALAVLGWGIWAAVWIMMGIWR